MSPLGAHVATFGMSFSGSTIFNYCLGSMPGCATINESHWLVHEHPSGVPIACLHCGEDCVVLDADFRSSLARSGRHYGAIADRLGCDVLVSSDKELFIYDELSPDADYVPVLLFKDPAYQTQSWLKATGVEPTREKIVEYLSFWARKNGLYLDRLEAIGAGVVLDTQLFQENPETTLRQVCEALRLPYSDDWRTYWTRVQHPVGGNFNPYSLANDGDIERLTVSPRRPPSILPEIVEAVEGHETARRALERLRSRSLVASAA